MFIYLLEIVKYFIILFECFINNNFISFIDTISDSLKILLYLVHFPPEINLLNLYETD